MNVHIHHFHSKGAVADHAALEQFQTQWATYQKLVDADALAHKEVGAVLHGALATIATPFAFVDIACAPLHRRFSSRSADVEPRIAASRSRLPPVERW
jgi:hypothetical protein